MTDISLHLPVDGVVLAAGLLLLLGVVGSVWAGQIRVPTVLVVLALGMAIGDDGLDLVSFSDARLAQSIAVAALVAILFDGGLGTTSARLRPVAAPAALLATVGVVVTAGVTAGAAALLFDVPGSTALLLGAIVASTDAAAVLSVLRRSPVNDRLRSLLEAESGFNDPVAVLLVVGILETVAADVGAADWIVFALRQLVVGAGVGLAVGMAGSWLLRQLARSSAVLAPVLGLAIGAAAYGSAAGVGASGFLATYLAGVVVSTRAPYWRRPLRRFHETSAMTAEIVLFLLLGLLAFPGRFGDVVWPALGVTAALVLVARPLAVSLALVPFGYRLPEVALVTWAGLRGAVPMVFATFPLTAGHPDGELLFDATFVVVLVVTAVQGTTVGPLARRLGVADEGRDATLAEAIPVDVAGVDVLEIVLGERSPAVGRPLQQIPLPAGVRVALVGRGEEVVVPGGATVLAVGDRVVVMGVGHPDLAGVVAGWAAPTPG